MTYLDNQEEKNLVACHLRWQSPNLWLQGSNSMLLVQFCDAATLWFCVKIGSLKEWLLTLDEHFKILHD